MTVRAGGGVVWRRRPDGGVDVLLVHRPRYDDWSLPKGKAGPDEDELACALREVEEETGLRCRPGRELPTTRYIDSLGRPKSVRYWAMAPIDGSLEAGPEVDDHRWVALEEAAVGLSYEHDVAVAAALSSVPLLLIRHAVAIARRKWSGSDMRRPLTTRGKRQARKLATLADVYAPERVLSSGAKRCVETVKPLAEVVGCRVEIEPTLAEGETSGAIDLLRALAGAPVAICTHGDVVPLLLDCVAAVDKVDLGDDPRWAKGSVWVLEADGDRFVRARYLEPNG